MGFDFTANFSKLLGLKKTLTTDMLSVFQKLMEKEVTALKVRTEGGKDIFGKAFDKYTPAYEKLKSGSGKVKNANKSARGANVNLRFTGNMMNSITSSVELVGGELVGIIAPAPNEAAKAKANNETRPFFGLSDNQRERLRSRIKEHIYK